MTRSGQGIGRAVAQLLASKGVKVAVNDIVPERAGIIIKDSLDNTDLERWNRILAVNLTADFLTIKQAVKRMRPQHYGRIVNVSSIAAKHAAAIWEALPTQPPRPTSQRSPEARPGNTRRTAST